MHQSPSRLRLISGRRKLYLNLASSSCLAPSAGSHLPLVVRCLWLTVSRTGLAPTASPRISSSLCNRTTKYVATWKVSASTPANPDQTDASRAKAIELEVQARVAQELKKLHAQSSKALSQAHDNISSSDTASSDNNGPSHQSISNEVAELRRKLEERKQIRQLPAEVESAREGVIKCLRDNDRRPLDCWEEVEKFKVEVKKLEKGWVNKVTS